MGLVYMGPPHELVIRLRDTLRLRHFIETGTFEARTARWAGQQFQRVTTIEVSQPLYEAALAASGPVRNIDFVLGDSRRVLPRLAAASDGPALFWLDGHYSGGATGGHEQECPLLEELAALRQFPHECCILIDDARLFCSPPPRPLRVERWPTLAQVFDAVRAIRPDFYSVLIDDAIIAVPPRAKELLATYCQQRNTESWEGRGARGGELASRKTAAALA